MGSNVQVMDEQENGRQFLSNAQLADMRARNAKLLALIGSLPPSDDPSWGERTLELVGDGVSRIVCLQKDRFDRLAGFGARGRAQCHAVEKMVCELIRGFSGVELPDTAEGRRLKDVLAHYRAEYLDDDVSLAKNFEAYRAEYRKNPEDAETCIRYGWLLHDCLKAASRRLCNVKLTEFFKKAFEEWTYSAEGPQTKRVQLLEKTRLEDLRRAEVFLNGPRDALEYAAHGKWEQALAAAKRFLGSNPGNEAAFKVALEACEGVGSLESHIDMFNICLTALDWQPNEAFYQKKFVFAASRIASGLKFVDNASGRKSELVLPLVKSGYGQLVKDLNEEFVRLKDLERKSWDYSSILVTATQAFMWVNRQKISNKTKFEYASAYASLVEKWDVQNFRPEDLKDTVGTRHWLSLAGRVVLALLACVELGVAHEADGWLMRFVDAAANLFKRDPSWYYRGLCKLHLLDGDQIVARRFAFDLVRWNQTEGWRWRVLGMTYSKGSQERADCLGRAKPLEKRLASAELLRRIQGLLGKVESGEMTPEECEDFRRKASAADARAEALLLEDAKEADGVILTWFTDKPSGKEVVRVWWHDGEAGHSDFVELQHLNGLERSMPGTPVRVFCTEVAGRTRVAKVAPRPEGASWDIYPFMCGIVTERDEGRQFAKILYAPGRLCSVDLRKHPAARNLACGTCCELAFHEREGLSPLALAVRAGNDGGEEMPKFCRAYQGVLRHAKKGRDGQVGDVLVPLDARDGARFGREVCGLAADYGCQGVPAWRAVTCREQ